MNTRATPGTAERLGFMLGRIVCLLVHARSPVVRWVKRLVLLIILGAVLVQTFSWILSVILTLACMALVLWGLGKKTPAFTLVDRGDYFAESYSLPCSREEGIWRDGPEGYGYYRVDDTRLDF